MRPLRPDKTITNSSRASSIKWVNSSLDKNEGFQSSVPEQRDGQLLCVVASTMRTEKQLLMDKDLIILEYKSPYDYDFE